MMSKAEVESLSSYNSEVEEKQARHIDNEVILMFLLGIINVNILTIFMFLSMMMNVVMLVTTANLKTTNMLSTRYSR